MISTLIEDIYGILDPDCDHEVQEENLDAFCDNLRSLLRDRLKVQGTKGGMRFSSLGRGDRQVYYDMNPDDTYPREKPSGKAQLKFLYGDVIEQLVIFLTKEAGHEVTREQEELDVDGVLGHIDCFIDGVLVDVKSAAPMEFEKFKSGAFLQNDLFGKIDQLAGYSNVLRPGQPAYWFAFDKVSAELVLAELPAGVQGFYQPAARISHLRDVAALPEPPARCHEDEEDGKSGNRKLGTVCSYCEWKNRCWPELRGFAYSGRPRWLTRVVREPKDIPEFGVA